LSAGIRSLPLDDFARPSQIVKEQVLSHSDEHRFKRSCNGRQGNEACGASDIIKPGVERRRNPSIGKEKGRKPVERATEEGSVKGFKFSRSVARSAGSGSYLNVTGVPLRSNPGFMPPPASRAR